MSQGGKNGKAAEQRAYVHGRIEREIEVYAERFSTDPMELKAWVGALLVGAEVHLLPSAGVQQAKAKLPRKAVAEVEVAGGAHVGSAQGKRRRGRGRPKTAPDKVKPKSDKYRKAMVDYWAKFSPLQRRREMARREEKRKANAAAAAA